ncbi:MAG: type I restriction-modification enzyme R subunit C-terminal domain-containing protein [Rubrivivax sp.]|nr:type I restriction-modification enzyme R subunit C-terminal domain-containing protein [Rubrivivax sp.]
MARRHKSAAPARRAQAWEGLALANPEQLARVEIDGLLQAAGWAVQDKARANLHATRGVAIREFPLEAGYGFADYLLYVEGRACGVIEAKKQGTTLTGVETQSARYAQGLPGSLPAWRRPLPFAYESTGVETHFTNGLDPAPRARSVFAFHTPALLAEWLKLLPVPTRLSTGGEPPAQAQATASTFLARLQQMPELVTEWGDFKLWPAQITAVRNLEASLAANKPRALIQMATGSGKTFTAISFIYRLIKFAGARRVLFLVDRGNLGRQAKKEFDAYVSPYNNYKFGEEYIVQHLQSNTLDTTARVTISTIQRLFSMLKGRELAEEDDERSTAQSESLFKDPEPIAYNPRFPIETFDLIVTDEAHRSIYNLWRQVLEYFDAHLIGLTATPNKQTFGFFNQNLVMEYGHAQAVADGVNVNYDVYRIRTAVSEQGAQVEAGYWLETMDRATRKKNAWQLDDDFDYAAEALDRKVQTPDQIRTLVRVIRDDDLRGVNPGEHVHKDHFVIVDCVGVCEHDLTDSRPMDAKKTVPLDALLQAVSLGNVEDEVLSSVAARLARLDTQLTEAERSQVRSASGGLDLKMLAGGIVQALQPKDDASPQEQEAALRQAVRPLADPALRQLILGLKANKDLVIDTVTQDRVIEAGFSAAARERAQGIVQTFEAFIAQHKDEITALQILYSRPTRAPLTFDDIKLLADALHAPPHLLDESTLWQAYAALDQSKVKGASRQRILTDLVSLVRFAMQQDNELVPYPERVAANYKAWLAQQASAGHVFTPEQQRWLEMIRDHVAANLGVTLDDFEYAPFSQQGGLGRVHQLFGAELRPLLDQLNRHLAA